MSYFHNLIYLEIKVQTTEKKPDPTKNKPVITDTPKIAQPVQKTAEIGRASCRERV